MFWRTVSDRNGFGTWKVRLMPPCTSLCEATPPIEASSKTTSPPSGAYRPEITLIAVVLPEPFGPTSPKISPGTTWKLRPSSAWKPPKRFITLETVRMGLLSGDTPAPPRCERDQASGQEQHQAHDQQAVNKLEILRRGKADQIVDAVEEDDADDRTGDGGDAAEQREHDGKNAEIAGEDVVGIEHRHVPGVHAAGEARDQSGRQ